MKVSHFILVVSAVYSLIACGDSPGSAGVPPPPAPPPPVAQPNNEVPTSATASTGAYVQYTGSLAASDSAEPLIVEKVTPPTSETEEPQVV